MREQQQANVASCCGERAFDTELCAAARCDAFPISRSQRAARNGVCGSSATSMTNVSLSIAKIIARRLRAWNRAVAERAWDSAIESRYYSLICSAVELAHKLSALLTFPSAWNIRIRARLERARIARRCVERRWSCGCATVGAVSSKQTHLRINAANSGVRGRVSCIVLPGFDWKHSFRCRGGKPASREVCVSV